MQPSYEDVLHRTQHASIDSLLAVLRCLGADIDRPEQAASLLTDRLHQRLAAGIEPVHVVWDGEATEMALALPKTAADGNVTCRIETDDGPRTTSRAVDELPAARRSAVHSRDFVQRRVPLPGGLPSGYFPLFVETSAGTFEACIISAPRRSYSENGFPERSGHNDDTGSNTGWGTFLPLYALRSERNWGAGDFTDLAALARWTGESGGEFVGTLPLLAAFLNDPCEPSPYAPASRLFWNEFYLDVTRVRELPHCPEAQATVSSAEFQQQLTRLRNAEQVQYRELMAVKRRVLEQLAQHFFDNPGARFNAFKRFAENGEEVRQYARFRAAYETRRTAWQRWPTAQQTGSLDDGDVDQQAMNYHLFVQWLADEQMRSLADSASQTGCGLYLDLPLGVRTDGYDVWRHQSVYATDATAGAPPDAVFTRGQDWAFPPLHPEGIRRNAYQHVRDILHHHMQYAKQLRIDHVMGLHRLYWIPAGLPPHAGVYVRYCPEEFYAVLSLESHRHQCRVVGEDLGTVPPEVNRHMKRHDIRRMYVVQYELQSEEEGEFLEAPEPLSVASLNTHDMPPFAAWWRGDDLPDRRDLGLLTVAEEGKERRRREQHIEELTRWLREADWLTDDSADGITDHRTADDTRGALQGLLRFLAAGPAESLLINLEDLWLETQPQNVPGTSQERPNWKRKARYRLEDIPTMPAVKTLLRQVSELRRWSSRQDGEPSPRSGQSR